MKRALLAVLTATVLATAACSGSDAPTPDESVSSAPPAPPASTEPSAEASPAFDCLTGTYRLARFVGVGDKATYGTGQGGDVTVTFDDGQYDLVGKGQRPITVNLAGSAAQLTIDGTVEGTYRPDGAEMAFTVGKATGQGTLKAGTERRTLPMASIAQVIAPSGKATLACPKNTLLIALPAVRLEFER